MDEVRYEGGVHMLSTASLISRVIATLAICSALAHSANAGLPDDACSLLTPAQVTTGLGAPVGAGAYMTPTFKKTCTWNATTNGAGTVTLNLQSLDQYEGGRKLAAYGNSVSTTSIGGIGDDAYYFGTSKLVSLMVKKGNVAFKLAVYAHIPIERQQAAEKALALQIVSQL
jgi:hypothetical protein